MRRINTSKKRLDIKIKDCDSEYKINKEIFKEVNEETKHFYKTMKQKEEYYDLINKKSKKEKLEKIESSFFDIIEMYLKKGYKPPYLSSEKKTLFMLNPLLMENKELVAFYQYINVDKINDNKTLFYLLRIVDVVINRLKKDENDLYKEIVIIKEKISNQFSKYTKKRSNSMIEGIKLKSENKKLIKYNKQTKKNIEKENNELRFYIKRNTLINNKKSRNVSNALMRNSIQYVQPKVLENKIQHSTIDDRKAKRSYATLIFRPKEKIVFNNISNVVKKYNRDSKVVENVNENENNFADSTFTSTKTKKLTSLKNILKNTQKKSTKINPEELVKETYKLINNKDNFLQFAYNNICDNNMAIVDGMAKEYARKFFSKENNLKVLNFINDKKIKKKNIVKIVTNVKEKITKMNVEDTFRNSYQFMSKSENINPLLQYIGSLDQKINKIEMNLIRKINEFI